MTDPDMPDMMLPRDVWGEIRQLHKYYNDLKEQQMSLQEEINAITSELEKVSGDIATVQTNLQSEIDNLAAQNPSVNLSNLRNAVAPLDAAVQALGKLEPVVPTPPTPETPPASTPAEQAAAETPVAESPPTV